MDKRLYGNKENTMQIEVQAQDSVPAHTHIHSDADNALACGSCELILARE